MPPSRLSDLYNTANARTNSNVLPSPLVDPVNKFRVSTPQTLIDTDFEYGIQSSKWETLELINNTPTFFNRIGDDTIPLNAVTATSGSSTIEVTTTTPHGLLPGNPFYISGLSSTSAEGFFIVYSRPDDYTFIYKAKASQSVTATISDAYGSLLYPGRLFQSTLFSGDNILSIETDGLDDSTITITTKFAHGLQVNSSLILTNTVGVKNAPFDASQVQTNATISTDFVIDATSNVPNSVGFGQKALTPYDWVGKKTVYFNPSDVSASTINIPGHNLSTSNYVMYTHPQGDTNVGGLCNYNLYMVNKVDDSNIRLHAVTSRPFTAGEKNKVLTCTFPGYTFGQSNYSYLGSPQIVSASGSAGGFASLWFWFRPTKTGAYTFQSYSSNARWQGWFGSNAVNFPYTSQKDLPSGSTNSNIGAWNSVTYYTANLVAGNYYPVYLYFQKNSTAAAVQYLRYRHSTDTAGVYYPTSNNADYGSGELYSYSMSNIANATLPYAISPTFQTFTSTATSNYGQHALIKAYPVIDYISSTSSIVTAVTSNNSLDASINSGDPIVFMSGDSNTQSWGYYFGLKSFNHISSTYYTKFNAKFPPTYSTAWSNYGAIPFKLNGIEAGFYPFPAIQGLQWIVPIKILDIYDSFYYKSHGLSKNAMLTYSNLNNSSNLAGLSNTSNYYVEVVNADYFRLKPAVSSNTIDLMSNVNAGTYRFRWTYSNPIANTIYLPDHGFVDGTLVTYSNMGSTTISGLSNNSTYYIANSSRDRFQLSISPNLTPITTINTVGTGQQSIYNFSERAVDGVYTVTQVTDTTIKILPGFNVPPNSYTFDPMKTITRSNQIFWPTHGYRTGTPLIYTADPNGTAIPGLANNSTYYLVRDGINVISLASTYTDALSNINKVAFGTLSGNGSNHTLTSYSVMGEVIASDAVGLSNGSTYVSASGYDFLAGRRPGDSFNAEIMNPWDSNMRITTVDSNANTVTTAAHVLSNGDYVYYIAGSRYIAPLVSNTKYFVRAPTTSTVSFYNTKTDAVSNINSIDIIGTGTAGSFGTLYFEGRRRIASITGGTLVGMPGHGFSNGDYFTYNSGTATVSPLIDGYIYFTNVSAVPNYPTNTSNFYMYNTYSDAISDVNRISVTASAGTLGAVLYRYSEGSIMINSTIAEVNTQCNVTIASAPTLSNPISGLAYATTSNARLLVQSAAYPVTDGYVSHRSLRSGVEIIPATKPNSQLIRQTRKYFRYQSGKGIQCSMAVNFSPYTEMNKLYRDGYTAYGITKRPHRLTTGLNIVISGTDDANWHGTFTITVVDINTFSYTLNTLPDNLSAGLVPRFYVTSWLDASARAGIFDGQNGLFYEYDGTNLYVVRRNSMQQLPGTASVVNGSTIVTGDDYCKFDVDTLTNANIVIKGQTYKVVAVNSESELAIMPPYRGITNSSVTISITNDTKVAQSHWNLDPCDGTGPSGYNLDIHKIQLIYIDYAWYGAGKVRFGLKGNRAELFYVHEFIHNNQRTESYLRSGNLPARYEVFTGGNPTYSPALIHWGVSMIMDGRYDEDGAYLFTAAGNTLTYGNGNTLAFSATTTQNDYVTVPGTSTKAYRILCASLSVVQNIPAGTLITGTNILPNTYTVGYITVNPNNGTQGYMYITTNPTAATTVTLTAGDSTDIIPSQVLLASVRLAPSVDNSRTGELGTREILNRMQLILNSVGIMTTHDVEVKLLLNGYPSKKTFTKMQQPSLSEVLLHSKGESIVGGTPVFSFRVPGGGSSANNNVLTVKSNSYVQDLQDVTVLGNSILGGNDVFPNGPDLMTVVATILDSTGVSISTPFKITSRITWSESQA